ncbi:hypothetical protein [Rubritalea sp.]|uniref:hypothetical protein n=1 Tax=Rubritalea sp. TaxID=2109375 RepID=UPI003EF6874F
MLYFELEPEVAGELGDSSIIDATVHPPIVTKLHYEFSGWLGDCLVESFPCYIIKSEVAELLQNSGFTGFSISDAQVSVSSEFVELHPNSNLGSWKWLRPSGRAGIDDIAVSSDHTLIVSNSVLNLLKSHGIDNCDVEQNRL